MTIAMIDNEQFRKVLGHYPTGVCAITAELDGEVVAMIVGTFTSVSLDPPLVGFLPDKASTSWPKIRASSKFCVNILGESQLDCCRKISSKAPDRFSSAGLTRTPQGVLALADAVAWLECDLHSVLEAGDHDIAICHVRALEANENGTPLLFFKGQFGRFSPHS